MNDVMYKIVFEGDLLPGFEQAAVQTKLAQLLHIDNAQAGKLFSGKQRDIKDNLSFDRAKKFIRAIAKQGALMFIQTYDEDETLVPMLDTDLGNAKTGTSKSDAFSAYFERQEAKKRMDAIDVPQDVPQIILENDWSEVSGEQKVRDIEKIARQILMQR